MDSFKSRIKHSMGRSRARKTRTRPQPRKHAVCADCIQIFKHASSLLSSPDGEPSVTLFDAAYQARLAANVASSKCRMCILLDASIPQIRVPFNTGEVLALATSRARHDPDAATVGLVGFDEEELGRRTGYAGSLRIHDVGHGHVRSLSAPTTWSLETLANIRTWMESCTSAHDCPAPKPSGKLPLRLIDVMPADSPHFNPTTMGQDEFDRLNLEQLPGVHIVETAHLLPGTRYLTLSHRWGNPPSTLLTEKTSVLLNQDIAPHLLRCDEAAVFQHAIHVTRALGFRYIWIDALCIMQDDEREKTEEIIRMDEIYSNSTLNISSTEGRLREGLVYERKLLCTNPCQVTVDATGSQSEVFLHAFPDRWFLRPGEGPLNKRGWVFQERMMAPRIVHFTKDQVFWECHSLEASEVLPRGVPGPRPAPPGIGISRAAPATNMKAWWYDVVENYSRTSLTFADDRLLAVSALAKRCCEGLGLHGSQYLAGMWRDDLPLSLLWSLYTRPETGGPVPATSQGNEMKYAPSWSWASVLWPVRTVGLSSVGDAAEMSPMVATAEVLDVQIARASTNWFGGATSCPLRLCGRVCKFRRCLRNGVPWVCVGEHTEFQEFGDFDFQKGKAIIVEWDTCRRAVADCLRADDNASEPSTYFLLHIASENSVDGLMERGIVLRSLEERGMYARVGSFFTPFNSEYPGSELEDAFTGHLATLSADDYLEIVFRERYVIDII